MGKGKSITTIVGLLRRRQIAMQQSLQEKTNSDLRKALALPRSERALCSGPLNGLNPQNELTSTCWSSSTARSASQRRLVEQEVPRAPRLSTCSAFVAQYAVTQTAVKDRTLSYCYENGLGSSCTAIIQQIWDALVFKHSRMVSAATRSIHEKLKQKP